MRNPMLLIFTLMAPLAASAHTGSHSDPGIADDIAHLVVMHFAPVIALAAAFVLIRPLSRRLVARRAGHLHDDRGEIRS
jgi:hypothetical protein